MSNNKFTVSSFMESKTAGKKISMLTAYDYTMARLVDEAGVDSILIGDSLGMVIQGKENTLSVTVDDIIYHCKAVAKAAKRAMVVGDMPFLSYHINTEESVRNAGRIISEGRAEAVKLEGGREMADVVKAIVRAQIPVIGHLGLTPQSVNMFGGFKVQGKNEESAKKIIEDALILQEAGAFAIVLECVPDRLAAMITEKLDIPTIGIGAGAACDGQVLVVQDMLGMFFDMRPKFVKNYSNAGEMAKEAVKNYIDEINSGKYPDKEHSFTIKDEILEKLY